jgi:hypothetical protein
MEDGILTCTSAAVQIFTCQNFYMSKFDRPKLPLISGLAVHGANLKK